MSEWQTHRLGQRAVGFLQCLTLVGDYSGQPWRLEPFQEEWVRRLYGTRNPDGTRQYSKVSWWLPRGLGKTQLAAGLVCYQLLSGPEGQEIYGCSSDREKAGRLFKAAAQMLRADPLLFRLVDISEYHYRIKVPSKNNTFQCLAATEDKGHGLAPSMLVCDELHLWDSRAMYDSLTSGFGKRKKGSRLEVQISTAGADRSGLAWDLFTYAKSVHDGLIIDPEMLVAILGAGEQDDWTDPATWRKAMPCSYVDFDFIASEFKLAQSLKYREHAFRQLYLNQWVDHTDAGTWIAPAEWEACQEDYDTTDLFNEPAYAALDLSSVRDLTALSLFFPRSRRCLSWGWLPGEGLKEREERDKVTYANWRDQGYLITTSGSRIVHEEVAAKVNEILATYDVVKFVADPWSIHLIAPFLNQEPERFPQTAEYLSPPTKWVETAIMNKTLRPNRNPLLAWAVANTVVGFDKYERAYPTKGKSRLRIDPCVALLSAIGAWLGSTPAIDLNKFLADRDNFIF
jgi:phage terminase large subunit-like protein